MVYYVEKERGFLIMYCKYCGAQVDDDAMFCPSCGKELKEHKQTVVNNYVNAQVAPKNNGKKKIVAGLFALFLGAVGVQHFYLGKVAAGVFSILFFWTWIPCIIGIIQGIIILCECDEDFEKRIAA